MRQKYLEILISFCLGVSWALSFGLAAYLFSHGLQAGFFTAFVLALVGLAFGFLFVAFFEGLSMLQDILLEKKEQTRLLREMLSKLKKPSDEKISDH
ncbi:MAG: hypothetical protein JHC37_03160 [Campylobacteraceae bacterium]|jgi:uncharacterized membrane protein YgaE (UPF0421/DUF939 family)|nr:hypothetical protein [Campylobacteraceae bacterium]